MDVGKGFWKALSPMSGNATKSVLGNLSWSLNPVPEGGTTLLEVHVLSGAWPIVAAEYIGSIDPGLGEGFPMAVSGTMIAATFVARAPKGTYPVAVRAKDAQGIWTELCPTELQIVEATK
jgi:hypothetical protein